MKASFLLSLGVTIITLTLSWIAILAFKQSIHWSMLGIKSNRVWYVLWTLICLPQSIISHMGLSRHAVGGQGGRQGRWESLDWERQRRAHNWPPFISSLLAWWVKVSTVTTHLHSLGNWGPVQVEFFHRFPCWYRSGVGKRPGLLHLLISLDNSPLFICFLLQSWE